MSVTERREETVRGVARALEPALFLSSTRVVPGVVRGAHEVKRHVWLVADNPAIVSRRDVEEISGFDLDDAAVHHGRDCFPGDSQPYMLHRTLLQPGRGADIDRPLPAQIISH